MRKYYSSFRLIAITVSLIFLSLISEVQAQEAPVEVEQPEEQEPVDAEKPEGNVAAEQKKPERKAKKNVMFQLEPLIVNLARSQGSRFLKITISLEMSSTEVRNGLEKSIRKINDSILLLLSTKSFEDVYSVQGKFTLKGEITTRVNQYLTVGQVKGAYFTEFLIQ